MDQRKEIESINLSIKQCTTLKKKIYRNENGRTYDCSTSIMDSILVSFGIDRARFHGELK